MKWLTKAGAVVERIRTPLMLAGLVVVVLYALYRQILKMEIFAAVSADQSFVLIGRILMYLFILALVAVALGGAGYFLSLQHEKSGPKSKR